MIKVTEAIKTINPNAQYTITGSDLETCTIEWHNGTTPIPKADIEAQMPTEFDDAMEDLRTKRDNLLKESDFVMLSDAPIAEGESSAWETYRRRLRNITNGLTTVAEVDAVTWPTKPGA